MEPNLAHTQIQRNRVVQIVLVHQREARVVGGVQIDHLRGAIFQCDFDHQVVGEKNTRTEFRIHVSGDAACRVEVNGHPAREVHIDWMTEGEPLCKLPESSRRPSARAVRV